MIRCLRTLAAIASALGAASCVPAVVGVGAAGADVTLGSRMNQNPAAQAPEDASLLLGGYFTDQADKSFDRADRDHLLRALREILAYGAPGTENGWINPDNGHWGTFTFVRAFQNQGGESCRDIGETITVDGHTRRATMTACRGTAASWRIANWSTQNST